MIEKKEEEKNVKKEKLGFFKRAYLAITDFRIYPFVQRENVSKSILYFLKLLILVSVILAIVSTFQIIEDVKEFLTNYNESVADFTIENGKLTVNEIIKEKYEDELLIYVNSEVSNEEFMALEESKILNDYDSYLLVNNDKAIFENGITNYGINFSGFEGTITKDTIYNYLMDVSTNIATKMLIGATLFTFIFIVFLVKKIFEALLSILVAYILSGLFGIKMKFPGYVKIITYTVTLPILLELTAILIVGYIPEYVTIAYSILEYVYLFYALRAIKLDAIIMSVPGNNMKEKVEQVIEKISKDIEKSVDEQAKKDEDDNDSDDSDKENK